MNVLIFFNRFEDDMILCALVSVYRKMLLSKWNTDRTKGRNL